MTDAAKRKMVIIDIGTRQGNSDLFERALRRLDTNVHDAILVKAEDLSPDLVQRLRELHDLPKIDLLPIKPEIDLPNWDDLMAGAISKLEKAVVFPPRTRKHRGKE